MGASVFVILAYLTWMRFIQPCRTRPDGGGGCGSGGVQPSPSLVPAPRSPKTLIAAARLEIPARAANPETSAGSPLAPSQNAPARRELYRSAAAWKDNRSLPASRHFCRSSGNRLGGAGDDPRRVAVAARQRADFLRHLRAVLIGHLHVHEDHLRTSFFAPAQGSRGRPSQIRPTGSACAVRAPSRAGSRCCPRRRGCSAAAPL